ncbi:thiol-disulfide isomerase/thioredoxin [Stackebrandtia endophytica]|uniref:Thiol-disulfide isomerase/thioredoxin n=1 Tax=Stackebrandtia endophytica TaxID=1496996 RepID=A0A543AVG8_9ACTN|nr:TlpA disulfide reductase family protein [Stackebrandtia endophytica]TQL76522.1 thiol-disulfide isomerase/thioredoxin [Stackebrandtia endophytica]
MKLSVLAAILVVVLSACASGPTVTDEDGDTAVTWNVDCSELETTAGTDFTDVSLPCLVGDGSYAIGPIGDRPMVVSLWASWCGPCVAEAPEVERFHQLLGDQVAVIGVNTQDVRERALYFADDFDWTFPSLFDERGEVMRGQGLMGLPAIIFIDVDGTTKATLSTGDVTTEVLVAAAEEHFGVTT